MGAGTRKSKTTGYLLDTKVLNLTRDPAQEVKKMSNWKIVFFTLMKIRYGGNDINETLEEVPYPLRFIIFVAENLEAGVA